jgi:ABC-2 type transport system permease protein
MAAHGVFLAICAAIAITASAWHRTSRGALISLMGIWIALWIVLPRVLPVVGTALYPVPPKATFDADVERQVRALGDSHDPNDPKFAALRARALAEHGVSRVEDLPFNYSGFVMQQGERHTSEAYQAHMSRLLDTLARQSRLVDWAGLFSPYLGIRTLSMGLAGSDAPHLIEFDRQAEAYRYALIESLNTLHMNQVPLAKDVEAADTHFGAPSRLRIDRAFFGDLPTFTYQTPSWRWALARRRTGLATALASTVVLAGVLVMTMRRRALAS